MYALRNGHGELFAYNVPALGMRFSDRIALTRQYKTKRGANIARRAYERNTGHALQVVPISAMRVRAVVIEGDATPATMEAVAQLMAQAVRT